MITTKRQVITEQDRYGGYSDRSLNHVGVDGAQNQDGQLYSARPQFEARGHDFSLMRADTETIQYSPRREDTSNATAEYIGLKERPRPVTYVSPLAVKRAEPKSRVREDVMPSIKKEYILSENEHKKEQRSGLSFKTKVMLSVYMAVVVVLAAIVIGTGYAITSTADSVSLLENEYMEKSQIVLMQENQLSMLGDDTYNTGRATESGMEKIDGDIVEIELTEAVAPAVYDMRTNWFDKFCDFLSRIIGE